MEERESGVSWVHLGRDGLLEKELLDRIIWQYAPRTSQTAVYQPSDTAPVEPAVTN
jgi:hypothetical protein